MKPSTTGNPESGPHRQWYYLKQVPVGPHESVLLAQIAWLYERREKVHQPEFKPLLPQGEFTVSYLAGERAVSLATPARGGPQARKRRGPPLAGNMRSLSNGHNSPQDCLREAAGCKAEFWLGAGLVRLVWVPGRSETLPAELIRHRGRVAGQSRKARARQMSKLAKVRTVGVPLPFFGARTFPDRVPDAGLVPGMDDRFFKRFLRRFPDAGVFWHRDLQERKSGKASSGELVPHFHDLIWGVPLLFEPQEERGEWVRFVKEVHQATLTDGSRVPVTEWRTYVAWLGADGVKRWGLEKICSNGTLDEVVEDDLQAWLMRNWYDVVGSGDLFHYSIHGAWLEVLQNPNSVKCYVSKPMRYVSKEQLEASRRSPYFFGYRSWGVRGSRNIPWGDRVVVPLSQAVYRCLLRAGRSYVRKVSGRAWKPRCKGFFVNDPLQWLRLVDYYVCEVDGPF